ncbi:hypothetical protein JCM8547_002698 [Rhodosporidiobolus lusitaniae]
MASLRRPPSASSAPTRRTRPAPAPLASSLASSSTSSLASPPVTGLTRSNTQYDVRAKRESTDGNIQVVVRCRGLSPSEAARGVPVVASVKATRGTEVQLTDPNPSISSSSAAANLGSGATGAAAAAQTKTWDFGDRVPEGAGAGGQEQPRGTVYGPDADQGMLYSDVAKPILQQVLQGYNCTIFAYGQTGTGKTYTMEGDLSAYHGTFHPDAGLIPRTLYSLFDRLAESKAEYSVRCSFVELYNEELRDLNAPDHASSSSSAPPSDASSTASSPEPGARPKLSAPKTLRIYEETKNGQTGVTIQGLEETFVPNAEEGLRVLRRGSERRQIAATNCNERSSRSHSIFTITVHVKDPSASSSQDVLKVGKLNLVDLAGSENVGRSGAVQGRAREAGMINASLLALGRVINQLVERGDGKKSGHVAYRESKLTRLLQDSLGGRTKTTIIATISPVSYEETASTLTYAHQAKSIQNRPEVNQRVSRNVVLNQFATEIERLKADLNAARGSQGVYVSRETWAELEAGRQSFESTKLKLEITESQLQTTRDQFEQNFRLLSTREEQLKKAQEELVAVRSELVATALGLEDTRLRLAQQEVLRDAFETSREGWKESAGEALDDVEGLRAKLERKSAVESANLAMIADARSAIAARTKQIDQRTTQLRRAQDEFVAKLGDRLDGFSNNQQLRLSSTSDLITSHLDTFASQLASLSSLKKTANSRSASFRQLVELTCARLFEVLREEDARVEQRQEEMAQELLRALSLHGEEVSKALDALVTPVFSLQEECRVVLVEDAQVLAALRDEDARALADENSRLKHVVSSLQHTLASEASSLRQEEEAILLSLQQQLAAATSRRLNVLRTTCGSVEEELQYLMTDKTERTEKSREGFEGLMSRNQSTAAQVDEVASGCVEVGKEAIEVLNSDVAKVSAQARHLAANAHTARQDQLETLQAAAVSVRAAGLDFRRDARSSKLSITSSLAGLVQRAGESYAAWQDTSISAGQEAIALSDDAIAQVDAYASTASRCLSLISDQTDDLADNLQRDLQSRVRHDVSTGATPAQRDRPVDRLLPSIDLDSDRPTVLERLLALRSQEVAATTAALDDGGEGVHTAAADVSVAGESPAVAAVVVPVAAGRASLAAGSAVHPGKGEAVRRVKPPVLGERDQNARRVIRRVTKAGK